MKLKCIRIKEGTFKNMVTDKKTRTVGSIIEMFERMTPAESLRMKEKTGLVIPEILPESRKEKDIVSIKSRKGKARSSTDKASGTD